MKEYNYSYNDDTKELTIYENNCVLATISDVEEEQTDEMFKEVIFELRSMYVTKKFIKSRNIKEV